MYEGFEIVTPQRWQSLITDVKEKVEDHYWDTDGLNEELLEPFIIDIISDTSDDDISDGGEDVDSMEEDDSAEDVCSYKSMLFIITNFIHRSNFALECHSASRQFYLITSRYIT